MPSITTVMKSGSEIIAPAVETVTPSPVIDGTSTKGAFYTNDMETAVKESRLSGLMQCLRPINASEPTVQELKPIDAPGVISDLYSKANEYIKSLESQCDFCKSYHGEVATVKFTLKDKFSGQIEIVDLCDDCINEESVFANKTVLRSTKIIR